MDEDLINNPNSLFDRLEGFLNLNLKDIKDKIGKQNHSKLVTLLVVID